MSETKPSLNAAPVWPRWATSLALALLVLLPFALFWPVWWPDPALRQDFAAGDFTEQHVAMRTFISDEIRQGRLPLWDPYTFGGEPSVAESLFETFYPLGYWQTLLPSPLPTQALELEAVFHLSLAGLFTFLFVRKLTGRPDAALLAGLTFSLSGLLTSYPMLQLVILEVGIWLPAGLWLIERALDRRSLFHIALAGAVLGIGLLAGHFQTFLYVVYASGSYLLFRCWQRRLGWKFTILAALAMGGAALALGAPQWIPSLEMARLSPRAGLSYEAVAQGFRPAELIGLILPRLGEWAPLYVGLIPLGLALLALILIRRGEIAYWGTLVLTCLFLSLGYNGFLYPVFYRIAPGFQLFRDQERAAYLIALGLAVLAGYGYAEILHRWPRIRLIFPLLFALTFADLYRVNHGVILEPLPAEGTTFPASSSIVRDLQTEPDPLWRVSSEGLLPGGANAGMVYHLRDITGNGPLYQADHDLFLKIVPEVRWWQLYNARYVLTPRTIDYPGVILEKDYGSLRLYRLELDGQPAWIVHQTQIVPQRDSSIWLTSDMAAIDPLKTVSLEVNPDPQPQPAAGPETVEITGFQPTEVQVKATLTSPGIVVLSEVDYSGWEVRIDGRPAKPLRAYGMFRAVAVPAGEHQITWTFHPWIVYIGLAIQSLAIFALAVIFIRKPR